MRFRRNSRVDGFWLPAGSPSRDHSLCYGMFGRAVLEPRVQPSASGGMQSAWGGGDHRARTTPQRGHDPPQPRGKGFAGNPGVAPPQEYPHHRALHPRRLRADAADGGGVEPGFGIKAADISPRDILAFHQARKPCGRRRTRAALHLGGGRSFGAGNVAIGQGKGILRGLSSAKDWLSLLSPERRIAKQFITMSYHRYE
jgi:hypothetical protein